MEDREMALQNEPDVTTRRGNSVARDTTLDVTWLSGTLDVTKTKEDVDLGSDHSVIVITIRNSRYRVVLGKARITDWDKMRNLPKNKKRRPRKNRSHLKENRPTLNGRGTRRRPYKNSPKISQ
ncbi:hypothetical protein MRX96_047093 [Rhipicephalus microplus]